MIPVYRADGEVAYTVTDKQLLRLQRGDRVRIDKHKNGKVRRATLLLRPGDSQPFTLGAYGTRYSFLQRLESGAGVWTLKPSSAVGGGMVWANSCYEY